MQYKTYKSHNKNFTLNDYKLAILKFYEENKRYPLTFDCDQCDYLPTSKTIQRNFGTYKSLIDQINKEYKLNIVVDTKKQKAEKIIKTNEKRDNLKIKLEKYLRDTFEPVNVHMFDKIAPETSKRADYGIYLPNGSKILLWLIFATTEQSFKSSLIQKLNRIQDIPLTDQLLIITMSNTISDDRIRHIINNKSTPLPSKVAVYSLDGIINELNKIKQNVGR